MRKARRDIKVRKAIKVRRGTKERRAIKVRRDTKERKALGYRARKDIRGRPHSMWDRITLVSQPRVT